MVDEELQNYLSRSKHKCYINYNKFFEQRKVVVIIFIRRFVLFQIYLYTVFSLDALELSRLSKIRNNSARLIKKKNLIKREELMFNCRL